MLHTARQTIRVLKQKGREGERELIITEVKLSLADEKYSMYVYE